MKAFKTKLTGSLRRTVMAQGRTAAQRGWERKSPYVNCRAEEAWYAGYDDEVANRGKLTHCTDCGHMFSTGEVCPSCDGTNVRPNVGEGTQIVMTVY